MTRFASRKQEIASRFSHAAESYPSHSSLQQAIADELLGLCVPGGVVLDAGCGRGRESCLLAEYDAVKKVIALDIAPAMLAALPDIGKIQPLLGDMEALPLPDSAVDLVFSSFAMQWCEAPEQVMAEMARVLKPQGQLCFSVPGPASLAALRATGFLQVNTFADLLTWEKALQQTGFRKHKSLRKNFTTYFAQARELLRALKGVGANASSTPRENHLLGRRWWQQVQKALELGRQPQGLPLNYDVIFFCARRD